MTGPEAANPLFAYPPQAAFDKVLPKSKIYSHAKPSRRLLQRFTSDVSQIVWKYKLAPETIRIPARAGIEEIQVFGVMLKGGADDDFAIDVLSCIDKAVGFPIIFEIMAREQVRVVAAYKRPNDADAAKWVVGDYFFSPWLPAAAARSPLPVALDLASLYALLLQRLMPHPPRPGESLRDHADRLARVMLLLRERDRVRARLKREKQFNLKVGINAELRTIESELDRLTQ